MESFIFNSFKQSLIEGKVNQAETWYAWPVNSKFIADYETKLPYFKTSADFSAFNTNNDVSSGTDWNDYWGKYQTTMYPVKYKYMAMQKTDVAMEPEYVTEDNFSFFVERNPEQSGLSALFFTSDNGNTDFTAHAVTAYDIDGNVKRIYKGFYYVKTSEELLWCANKVNGLNYDNTIKIVLGDNIGTTIASADRNTILKNPDLKTINYSIGSNPAQPFEGILFGNGFKILNVNLVCSNDTNGIVGYLGTSGVISTIDISGTNVLTCDKKITLDHMITDGNDISVGLLCGKNNGKIEHVRVCGDVILNNFVPSVYSTYNKTDADDKSDVMSQAYLFYPDYYCYNNPGNIVPYIGYFNEGVFATFSGYDKSNGQGLIHNYWNTIASPIDIKESTRMPSTSPSDWFYWLGQPEPNGNGYIMHYTAPENRKNILFYDANIFAATNSQSGMAVSDLGLLPNNGALGNSFASLEYAPYLDKSLKLSQQNRQAYYVSPVIGTNNSQVSNVNVSATITTSGTFVGFIGGLAGKQTRGVIIDSYINIHSDDITTFENFSANNKPLEGVDFYPYYLRDSINTDKVSFVKKSIKNIGGIFGSLVAAGYQTEFADYCPATILHSVTGNFVNNNMVIYKNGTLEYDDYYFLDRYGGLAAMVDFNASNIPDMWRTQEQLNTPGFRCIKVSNSVFEYSEYPTIIQYPGTAPLARYTTSEASTLFAETDGKFHMLGISSPLYSEIKPTYVLLPSIIESPFFNHGGSDFPQLATNYAYMRNGSLVVQDHPSNASIAFGAVEIPEYTEQIYGDNNRIGLYTIDQQLASPVTNINFWCINTEVDLPGVQNGVPPTAASAIGVVDGKKTYGYAGGIVDKFNCSGGLNYSLDVKDLASKLVYWDAISPNYVLTNPTNPFWNVFNTVTVPANANINPAYAMVISGDNTVVSANMPCPEYVSRMNNLDPTLSNTSAVAYTYNFLGSPKEINTYSYFGSDIMLIPNTTTTAEQTAEDSDIINPDLYESVDMYAPYPLEQEIKTHDGGFLNGHSHHLYFAVDTVRINIKSEAFKYQPFTEVPITYEQVKSYYNIRAHVRAGVGSQFDGQWLTPKNYEEEQSVRLADKFNNWNMYYSRLGPSGFYFYIDYTDQSNNSEYAWFILPFNFIPFSYSAQYQTSPPFNNFYGVYAHTPGGNGSRHNGQKPVYLDTQVPLTMSAVTVNYNTYIFNGYEDAEQTTPIWAVNQEPTNVVTAALTGYRWQDFGASVTPNIQFIKAGTLSNPEPTLDVTEAESAYVDGLTTNYTAYQITATDGLNYTVYSAYDTVQHLEMSALSWANIPSANWNWQNPIADKMSEASDQGFSAYKYDSLGAAAHIPSGVDIIRNASTPQYIVRKPWYQLDKKGYFVNALLNCNAFIDEGLIVAPEQDASWDWSRLNNTRFDFTKPAYSGFDSSYNSTIKYNLKYDGVINGGDENNFYKYTYDKLVVYSADIGKDGIKIPVKFGSEPTLNRSGFWFSNSDNLVDDTEKNNGIVYRPNIFNIGKTLSPESILSVLKSNPSHEYTVSGFSADDFEGLYITRNNNIMSEPVMYIDVGLGECNQGTSWSYECLPNRGFASGLFLEVN